MRILQRKQLFRKMNNLSVHNVVILCAPMGYGKTTDLKKYLGSLQDEAIWFSTEGECDEEWIWKKVQAEISKINGQEPDSLGNGIPVRRPENEAWICENFSKKERPIHIVLDDFVWGSYPALETWLFLCSAQTDANVKIWVLTRTVPEGRLIEQICRNQIGLLYTEDFAFTEEEVKRLCDKDMLQSKEDLPAVIREYTNGWIAAIQLVLAYYKTNHQLHNPLELNWLMKVAFYDTVEEPLKVILMKLSILKEFTWRQAEYMCEQEQVRLLLSKMNHNNYYLYQVDGEKYRITSVCREMLKRELLKSTLDIKALYNRSGEWFLGDGKPIEAIQSYAYNGNYDRIIYIIKRYDDRSLMDMSPELMQQVFRNMPEGYRREYPYVYMKWIQDVITNVSISEGKALLEAYREEIQLGMVRGAQESLMGEYYFARAFTQFNDARKMHEDFKKAHEFLEATGVEVARLAYPYMVDTFGANHMLYLYHNQPGDLQALVNDIGEKACHFIRISGGVNSGMEYQTAAEYKFETGTCDKVEELTVKAFSDAQSADRSSIMICSQMLRGRYGIWSGDVELTEQMIAQLGEARDKSPNPIVRCEADCALAYLHGLRGEESRIPLWIRRGEVNQSALLPEGAGTFYIAYGLALLISQDYKTLLKMSVVLEALSERGGHIFGKIYAKIYKSVSYFKLFKMEEATASMRELLMLCEQDHIIMPLMEFQEYLTGIVDGAVYKGEIVKELIQVYKRRQKKDGKKIRTNHIHLTKKEEEVLVLNMRGMRVQDIANIMEISVNTVRTHMKSLYRKWGVNSKVGLMVAYEQQKKREASTK